MIEPEQLSLMCLPDEAISRIMHALPREHLLALSSTCTRIRQLTWKPQSWRELSINIFDRNCNVITSLFDVISDIGKFVNKLKLRVRGRHETHINRVLTLLPELEFLYIDFKYDKRLNDEDDDSDDDYDDDNDDDDKGSTVLFGRCEKLKEITFAQIKCYGHETYTSLATIPALEKVEFIDVWTKCKIGFENYFKTANLRYLTHFSVTNSSVAPFLSSISGIPMVDLCLLLLVKQQFQQSQIKTLKVSCFYNLTFLAIGSISQLGNSLEYLDLSWCSLSELDINPLSSLKKLRKLNLRSTNVTNVDLIFILELTYLSELILDNCQRIDDSALFVLSNLKCIENLGLPINISDDGLFELSQLISLKKLSFSNCEKFTDYSGISLLITLTNLTSLAFHSCNISDVGLIMVAELVNLKELDLSFCRCITDSGFNVLGNIKNLSSLNLHSCSEFTDSGLFYLQFLSKMTVLNLSCLDKITNEGLYYLQFLTNLESLSLSYNKQITDTGLFFLSHLSKLSSLNLFACGGITDDGLGLVCEVNSLTYLVVLKCDKLTDTGFVYLSRLGNLSSMSFGNDQITDVGLMSVGEVSSMKELEISNCPNITDSGVLHLISDDCCPRLSILQVNCCSGVSYEVTKLLAAQFDKT